MATLTFDFTGQVVLVTGAARGIGLELSRFFVDAGATAWMLDLDAAEVEAAAKQVGGRALQVDVTSTEQVDDAVSEIIAQSGRIDVLVNNAGTLRDSVVWKMDDEQWGSVLDIHLGGAFRCTRACVPHFRAQGGGRIISMTSYSGIRGNTGQANYSSAKAGLIGFTKTTAKELARFGVTVNAISPNAKTRMIESVPEEKLAELASAIPMQRFAEASEMCAAVGFLASEEAGYITGVIMPVDGGIAM